MTTYYLNFYSLYRVTEKEYRIIVRQQMNKKLRDEIMTKRLKSQHNQCFYCGDEITMKDHLDHVIPIYYGGTNRLSNLVASCKSCNITKLTDQIEITNPYTIADYLKLREKKLKWDMKVKHNKRLKRYTPKKVHLYKTYRVDLFKELKIVRY